MKGKGLVLLGVLLCGMFLTPSHVVKASSTVEITDTLWYYNASPGVEFANWDYQYVTLANGKFFFMYISLTNSHLLKLRVYNADGTVYGSTEVQTSSSYLMRDATLYYVSDTDIRIFFIQQYTSTTNYARFGYFIFNPTAVSAGTLYYTSGISFGGSVVNIMYSHFTQMLLYSSKYYAINSITTYDSSNGYKYWTNLVSVSGTTVSYTDLQSDSTYGWGKYTLVPYWFQHPTDSSYAYAMYGSSGTAMSFYSINLSAKTATLIVGMWDSNYAVTNAQSVNSHLIGGDLVVNGTDSYLYFNWLQSTLSGGVPIWRFCSDRMKFNATTPTTATFQLHMSYLHETTSGSYSGVTIPYWFIGYEVDKSHIYIYMPTNTVSGVIYATRHYLTALDWFHDDGYSWEYDSQYPSTDNIPLQVEKDRPLNFGFTSEYALGYDGTHIHLFHDLSTSIAVYTATVSYLPADTPALSQNTQYTFTVTAYKNSIATQYLNIRFLSNGVEQSPPFKATNSQGKVVYLVTFTQANVYDFDFEVYDPYSMYPTTKQYTLSTTYIVSYTPGVPTGDDPTNLINTNLISSTQLMGTFIPSFIVVVAPALLFIPFGGAGMVIGLGIGTLLGVATGMLPFYILFILILLVAIGLVMTFRGGLAGNQGEG